MPKIIWDESFSVNNIEIDNQHKEWIEIINELHDALFEGKGVGAITGKSLNAMIEYGQFHFSYEEELMKKVNYPDFNDHKFMHIKLMGKIEQYQFDQQKGSIVLNRTIMEELMNWLQNHILKEDKKYVSFLQKKNVKST